MLRVRSMMSRRAAAACLLFVAFTGQAFAAPGQAPAPAIVTANPSAGNLLQTIFALCVVLGLLGVLAWVLKRFGPKAATGTANIKIVGALNLGGRERIMVVEVGDQWIVVGASPGRVNALATMPRQDDPSAQATATLETYQSASGSFAEWLKQTIEKRK
jgi:flagellar protein FliO/FliZ